jgi:hypothetical protein
MGGIRSLSMACKYHVFDEKSSENLQNPKINLHKRHFKCKGIKKEWCLKDCDVFYIGFSQSVIINNYTHSYIFLFLLDRACSLA